MELRMILLPHSTFQKVEFFMESHHIVSGIIFLCLFFIISSVLQIFSNRTSFPYTVSLLVGGLIIQFFTRILGLEASVSLDPNLIYYLLLPLLLFEAGMKIDIHQFRLQFWTITFMSTFGLLISMFVIGGGLFYLLGLPFEVALLFGALISATDPIAVLSIFNSLGAPKRLSLLADGESMFNDATAVIAFKVVAVFALGTAVQVSHSPLMTLWQFVYVFFGSIIIGGSLGYFASELIKRVKNDPVIESTITLTLAIGSFILGDHIIHLSGVITTVSTALIFGHFSKTRISRNVKHFVHEFWNYISYISISLVFFFAAFQLNISQIVVHAPDLPLVIFLILLGRAVSVYLSFAITNRFSLFNSEPDVPLSWQHILNWGGLRGVIPLVLAYTLPETFIYREIIISFTLATFVFTLLVNAITIRWLLVKLGLHLPQKEEEIIQAEKALYKLEQKMKSLAFIPELKVSHLAEKQLKEAILIHKQKLLDVSDEKQLKEAISLQALEIIRAKLQSLYDDGYINEGVMIEYGAQLDLQQDSIEYPQVYSGRGYNEGRLPNRKLFRQRLLFWRSMIKQVPLFNGFFKNTEQEIIIERIMMLKAKLICAHLVIKYFNRLKTLFESKYTIIKIIRETEQSYKERTKEYQSDLNDMENKYQTLFNSYREKIAYNLLNT